MGFKTEISKLHYDKNAKGLLFQTLKLASLFYAMGSGLKNKLYDKGLLRGEKVGAFVVSVGNLTTGGVGKTPVVAEFARYFISRGEKVAIISRGYGGGLSNKQINVISDGKTVFFDAKMAGDEPFWLAKNVAGACVLTSKNRVAAAKFAVEKFGISRIILDDGFQHRKIHRDLDLVLIDSEKGFGNENLLPAGPLREGLEAFSRIDKLIIVSKNLEHSRAEKFAKIMGKKLKKHSVVCYTEPDYAYNIANPESQLALGESVVAFSAIGQPQQFYAFLNNYLAQETIDFDDHHSYSQIDADNLVKRCMALGVSNLITTEKDAVKLMDLDFHGINVFALRLKSKLDVEALCRSEG